MTLRELTLAYFQYYAIAAYIVVALTAGGFAVKGLMEGRAGILPVAAAALDALLAADDHELDLVIELAVDPDVVTERLLKRAQIEGRVDDTEDVIRRRLEVYTEQTAPLTAIYADHGILVQVDGMGSVDEVTARILAACGL